MKVSHTKKKYWATDDPGHQCDGHGHFALSASGEDILERRRQHHAILDMEARKKARQAKSPDRDYGFSNLNVQEQGEKPSPGLRQAAKSAPRTIESSSSETLNPDWEGRAENVWRAETESWGTPHHHTPEHRQEAKAIDKSWWETRMKHQRAERDAVMAGGSSPPSKKRAASQSLMNDIDDPNGEVMRSMTAQERRERDRFMLDVKSPKGYKTREVQLTRTYLWGDEQSSSGGESVGVKVTWEPERGSSSSPIVKEIRLNPDNIDEEGMTWDSEGNMETLVDYPFVESKEKIVLVISLLNTLHDLNYVGIDTCSTVSGSTERGDFSFIDDSQAAKDSVILRGVGGENTVIGGRGPMVVQAKDSNGNDILVFDPPGVYLDQAEQDDSQARFRIFGQSKLKRAGLKFHQDRYDDGHDYLVYRGGEVEIPTETIDEIVALKTTVRELTHEQENGLIEHLKRIISEGKGGPAFVQVEQCASFIMNETNLFREQMARLVHWRQAHRQAGEGVIHENCPVSEEGKRKTKGFKRNHDYREQVTKKFSPYHRICADGYGGQNSMGAESYQGAKGGFVFTCPSSGTIKMKLYATFAQFPVILYQVLQEIEAEGYSCREVYVDTFKVNFSAAAEEVAAMFKVRIVPVSSGTPQENAYAESAVRTIATMPRSLMAGAPHLDESCWGLSDVYNAATVETLPQQGHDKRSPHEIKKGWVPDPEVLFIHVFGCPVQYESHGGALHKRGRKTEWGYFVGVQWPMVLVLRPEDGKVMSVSRKKVLCH